MTEKSYFYNGVTAGDADQAPYSANLYSKLRRILWASGESYIFGPYTTGDPFAVSPSAGMVIQIAAPADDAFAFISGIFVTLDANATLTIPANTSGLPRIDRIVIRVNWNIPEVTLEVKSGTPGITPVIPSLIQIPNDIYEMPLARIYVPDSLAAVTAGYIIDEREFCERTESYYANENLMPNTEFMASWGSGSDVLGGVAYDVVPFWNLRLATTTGIIDEKFPQMNRGSTIRITCPNLNDGITCNIPDLAADFDIPVTIRLLIEVIQGEVWIDTAGGGANGVRVPPTNGPVEVILRRTFNAGDQALELWIYNILSTQTVFRLGQITISHGLVGAPYQSKKEVILFTKKHIDDVSSLTLSTQTIDIIPDDIIRPGMSAVIMQIHAYDSGSAGVAPVTVSLQDTNNNADQLSLQIGRHASTYNQVVQGFVGVPATGAPPTQKMQLVIVASGASTLSLFLSYLGCVT